MKRDDADDLPSSSSADYFNADHGKAAHQEKKAKETGKLSQLKRELLKADMNPDKAATVGDIQDQEQADADQAAKDAARDPKADALKPWATKGTMAEQDSAQKAEETGKPTPESSRLQQLRQKIVKDQTKPERASGSND